MEFLCCVYYVVLCTLFINCTMCLAILYSGQLYQLMVDLMRILCLCNLLDLELLGSYLLISIGYLYDNITLTYITSKGFQEFFCMII
jgi:hypothetical protein